MRLSTEFHKRIRLVKTNLILMTNIVLHFKYSMPIRAQYLLFCGGLGSTTSCDLLPLSFVR